jgi:MFS family permease
MAFIITTWYKRGEVQKRLAVFYLSAISLAGFGSILAYAIQLLGNRGGLRGWRWIFLLEGLLTIALGALSWLYIPDLPDRNSFLTPVETKMVLDRIEADRQDSLPDPITGKKVLKHLCDPFLWSCGEFNPFFCHA